MLTDAILAELRAICGAEQVHVGPAELVAYSYDGTFQQHVPEVAVTPESEADVQRIMQLASRERIAVVPRGAWPGSCWPSYEVDYAAVEAYLPAGDEVLAAHLGQAPEANENSEVRHG